MDVLSLKDISYTGAIEARRIGNITETLKPFSFDFVFGKSYFLDSDIGQGGWALSWIIAGQTKEASGTVKFNDTELSLKDRQRISWRVRRSQLGRRWFGRPTVISQIRSGLRQNPNPFLKTENDIIEKFRLTPQRINRPLHQLSHEAWRASPAIGLAAGKRIFCFPNAEYLRPKLIIEYYDLWLKEMIDLLRDSGALVLFPSKLTDEQIMFLPDSTATDTIRDLCDIIVPVG